MISATIRSNGRITIPEKVRDSLMLKSGDKIEFVFIGKTEAIIRRLSKRLDEVFGVLHLAGQVPFSVEEMNRNIADRMQPSDDNGSEPI